VTPSRAQHEPAIRRIVHLSWPRTEANVSFSSGLAQITNTPREAVVYRMLMAKIQAPATTAPRPRMIAQCQIDGQRDRCKSGAGHADAMT
jgi:hypothetical protein